MHEEIISTNAETETQLETVICRLVSYTNQCLNQ